MPSDKHPITNTLALALAVVLALALALALAVAAIAPGATTAKGEPHPRPTAAPPRRPPVQAIRVSTHTFDWGDAGIGAAAGFGLSMLTIGGRLLIADTPRRHRYVNPR